MNTPRLTKHAKERICERFNVKEGGEQKFFDRWFSKAEFVCEKDGASVYIVGNIRFIIALKTDTVVTVINHTEYADKPAQLSFKQRVQAFIKSEIDRIKNGGEQEVALVLSLKTDIIGELADRYDELGRTRSLPKQLALKGRIAALEERLGEVPSDMKHVRDEVRRKINGALAHY